MSRADDLLDEYCCGCTRGLALVWDGVFEK